eukprot:9727471-Lingulodinium_polyedra.AAC.1
MVAVSPTTGGTVVDPSKLAMLIEHGGRGDAIWNSPAQHRMQSTPLTCDVDIFGEEEEISDAE